ncbi:hypothetical protein DNTS_014630 [Danionella cerebrum]|uniref:RING-type domain-containing protein n=1 Tax=Danionella cerebrum TaxID=2873325 RepID=A0A553R8H9_9TELE|nr:hypothetical protein DNTS_014630 [Danionella translucida]
MSLWISCNACFSSPGPARQLAITNCGHIVCNVCFQRGKQGLCLICKAKCKFSPLSEKSSSDVQILFSDISSVAVKYFSEISKVVKFQTKHQKRLLTHYEQTVERMKEERLEMKLEMQKMSEKIVEQQAYISKLEMTVHSQSFSDEQLSLFLSVLDVTGFVRHPPLSGRDLTAGGSLTKRGFSQKLTVERPHGFGSSQSIKPEPFNPIQSFCQRALQWSTGAHDESVLCRGLPPGVDPSVQAAFKIPLRVSCDAPVTRTQ